MNQQRCNTAALALTMLLASTSLAADISVPRDTRLIEAVKSGETLQVKKLIRLHAAVDSREGDGTTALHWAVTTDNLALAEVLLAAHADPNAETRLASLTPLHLAAQSGSAGLIELLLKHGALVDKPNGLGTTPLMMAAASGNSAAVTALVEHGAAVNLREHVHEQTALMFAANLDRADVIRVLLAHGADPNLSSKVVEIPRIDFRGKKTTDKTTEKSTGTAAASTKQETSKPDAAKPEDDLIAAFRKAAAERNAKLMGGMTPLLYAAREGNIASATVLLDGGAKINQVSGSEHTTPLVLAIANGHYDFARLLIERGADVNLANDMGVAPLYATIDVRWPPHEWSGEPIVDQEKTDYLTLMKMLLDRGANPNATIKKQVWSRILSENRNWIDPVGSSAFWRAAQANDVKAMELLEAGGADPNQPSKIGTTPLMVAAGLGWSANYSTTAPTRLAAIEYCLQMGADVNARDSLGYTALHGAAFVGDLKNIQYLVDHGAKIDARTKAGDTVADLANGPFEKSLPNPEAVALLEKLGSINSHNCRSSDCVPPVKEDKKPVVAEVKDPAKPDTKKPTTER